MTNTFVTLALVISTLLRLIPYPFHVQRCLDLLPCGRVVGRGSTSSDQTGLLMTAPLLRMTVYIDNIGNAFS